MLHNYIYMLWGVLCVSICPPHNCVHTKSKGNSNYACGIYVYMYICVK